MRIQREVHPWRVTLFTSNLANDGGAEVQTMELARALAGRGWPVSLLSMRRPKLNCEGLRSQGIPVHTLNADGGNPAQLMWRLNAFLRAERPHILHSHMSHAVLAARMARLVNAIPVLIGTLHGLKMYDARGTGWRLREGASGLTDRLSDATTVVCNAAAGHYLSAGAISRQALRVIPNGITTDRFRPDTALRHSLRTQMGLAGDFVWLMAGRFQPVKDHHSLLRGFARVVSASPKSLLLLAGNGPLQQELEELARGLGIGSRVKFLGLRSDIPALMNAADACVLSSAYEALPMVLLEAAATGLPIVTTDVGGTSDIVIHGVTGYLVPPSNPEALADAMLRLSGLPRNNLKRMGEQARNHVCSQFDLEDVVNRWESLYHELLTRNGVRA